MFRSPTGHTGMDAYRFELAMIENAKRELDERMVRLTETIAAELPEDATGFLPMPSDKFPDFKHPIDREGIISQLTFHPTAEAFTFDRIREILDNINT